MILTIKTDSPVAELGLFDQSGSLVARHTWQADRQLAATLLTSIEDFCAAQGQSLNDLTGVVVYSGSGSFTGLRIGASVANALAYSLSIKVAKSSGEDWRDDLLGLLDAAKKGTYVVPDYDRPANITQPK